MAGCCCVFGWSSVSSALERPEPEGRGNWKGSVDRGRERPSDLDGNCNDHQADAVMEHRTTTGAFDADNHDAGVPRQLVGNARHDSAAGQVHPAPALALVLRRRAGHGASGRYRRPAAAVARAELRGGSTSSRTNNLVKR